MKKILIAAAMTLMCTAAFAQNSTGPAPQSDNMDKPGVSNGMKSGTTGMSQDGMTKKHAKKGSMSNDTMNHDSMSKDMKK